MLDKYYKMLSPTETMKEALPIIKEAFVEFYGEENRSRIEEHFDSVILIGYQKPKNIKRIISKISDEISTILITEFYSKIDIPFTEENYNLLLGKHKLDFANLCPLSHYSEFVKDYALGEEGRIEKQRNLLIFQFQRFIPELNENNYQDYINNPTFQYLLEAFRYIKGDPEEDLKNAANRDYNRKKKQVLPLIQHFYPEATIENLDELKQSGKLDKLDYYLKEFLDIKDKYDKYMSTLSSYTEYAEKEEERFRDLDKKYMLQLAEEFKDYLDKEELEKLKQGRLFCSKIEATIGFNLNCTPLLDSFSEESEKIVEKGGWRAESILNDRCSYFKTFGIDLGPNYEDYKNSPECQSLLPPKEIIDKIMHRRYELKNKMLYEYYLGLDEYKQNLDMLRKYNLALELSYNPKAYEQTAIFVSPNLSTEGVVHPLLCVSMEGLEEYLDKSFIHELNHLYELELTEVREGEVEFICGWDNVIQYFGTADEEEDLQNKDSSKREYELFSEIINELIAQEITTILFQKGHFTFGDRQFSKVSGGTSYEYTFFLVKSFWETYRDAIIASRKNHNIQIIYNEVGKENFDALNKLFHKFHSKFQGLAYVNAVLSKRDGKVNDLTIGLDELIKERDEILSRMAEYNKRKVGRI